MPVAAKSAERANESRLKKAKPESKLETAGMMRWLLTYADMITLLLALFIILFSISTINKVKYQALVHDISGGFDNQWAINNPPNGSPGDKTAQSAAQQLQQLQVELNKYLKQSGLQNKVHTEFQRNDLVISVLPNDAFYDSGSAALQPQAKQTLDKIGAFLKRTNTDIKIHGHTDDVPINTSQFPSNWELSAARAVTVARYLSETDGIDPSRISASAFGQFRAGHPDDTESDRQLNRRVDIILHAPNTQE